MKVWTSNKYRWIWLNGKNVPEHRIVMENYLGRKLLDTQVVHHINGKHADNRIENLKLFISHSEHMKEHNKNKKNEGKYFECIVCGKAYYRILSKIKTGRIKYCSRICLGKGRYKERMISNQGRFI